MEQHQKSHILDHTADIVSSYVQRNHVNASELPELIALVSGSLEALYFGEKPKAPERGDPFVPIKHSIQPDYLVCLEDGAKKKMLKRYLLRKFGMTPDDYRRRWGLGPDYPMVAPNYAATRSDMAKANGLGTRTGYARVPGQSAA